MVKQNNCINVPYQECESIPYEHCEDVYTSVPEQIFKKRPFEVCGPDDEGYEFTDQEIEDYDFGFD